MNGKLQYDVTSEFLGGAGTDYRLQLGIAHQEHPSADTAVYVDEVFVANGFPVPVVP
jgi:oxalate decarboxylase/phosphoglucose isomerase-like protein (cupin superfamily)